MTPALADYPEIVVVLGAGLLRDGSPNAATVARAEAAAALARERPDAAFITSGSHGDGPRPTRTEAEHIADALVRSGVDAGRVFIEDESRDTVSNAAFVAERYLVTLSPRPLTILTSPFHLARSLETFRLILGPRWTVNGRASAAVEGDEARLATEALYLERTRERLRGIVPGDVARAAARARATIPENVSDALP